MTTAIDRAKAFLKLAKSVDDEVLADVAQIDDITLNKEKVPSAGELGSGGSEEMRGFRAMNNRMEPGTPQMGTVRDYEELVGRLGRTEKAIQALAANMGEALKLMSKGAQGEGLEAASAILRKAKIVLAKADGEDEDDDDFKDRMEKAAAFLAKAQAAIEKAEEDADDDEKEEAADKARAKFKALRKAMKEAHEKRAADKLAKAEALKKADDEKKLAEEEAKESAEKARLEAEAAAKAAAEGAVTGAPTVDAELVTQLKSLTDQLGVQQTTIAGMMSRIGGQSASGQVGAPMVVKGTGDGEVVVKASEKVWDALEAASDAGTMESGYIIKGHSLLSRLRAVEDGKLDKAIFEAEVAKAPENLKPFFLAVA